MDKSIKKVGILGGTFNPIHNGHIALAKQAFEELRLDKILIMPSGNSYMKKDVLSSDKRAQMVSLAIEDYPFMELSLIEVERSGATYTFETLETLKNQNPNCEYYFITGADILFQIESWYKPERIFELCTLACSVRDDHDMNDLKEQGKKLERVGAKVIFLKLPKIDISSSTIRTNVKNRISISDLVPISVLEYIEEEHLYED